MPGLDEMLMVKGDQNEEAGTGSGFGRVVLICAGVSALVACLLTVMYERYHVTYTR